MVIHNKFVSRDNTDQSAHDGEIRAQYDEYISK